MPEPSVGFKYPLEMVEVAAEVAREFASEETERAALKTFRFTVAALVGEKWASVALDEVTGNQFRSNAEIARDIGVTRAAVSKFLIRIRRHLGQPVRVPNNRRAGSKPKNALIAAVHAHNPDLG